MQMGPLELEIRRAFRDVVDEALLAEDVKRRAREHSERASEGIDQDPLALNLTEAAAFSRTIPGELRIECETGHMHAEERGNLNWFVEFDCLEAWIAELECPHGLGRGEPEDN
jgi:hypothetical protein